MILVFRVAFVVFRFSENFEEKVSRGSRYTKAFQVESSLNLSESSVHFSSIHQYTTNPIQQTSIQQIPLNPRKINSPCTLVSELCFMY